MPFFLTRWGNDLAGPETLETYINLAIQDIFNENTWTFKIKNEEILTYEDTETRRIFKTSYPIDQIIEIVDQDWDEVFASANFLKELDQFNFQDKNLLFLLEDKSWRAQEITEIRITYAMQYTFYQHNKDGTNPIPLPDKFIPAVIKAVYDYAAPINLFDGEQTQVDFFGHYTNRVNKLKDIDSLSEITHFIPVNIY